MLQHVGHLDENTYFFLREHYDTWVFSIIGSIFIGLSGIFPLLVIPVESGPALKHGEAAKNLRLMLSFAVGSLLGDVFLHLLPEVWSHLDRDSHGDFTMSGLMVILGLLTFMAIEKLMGDDSENEPISLPDPCNEDKDVPSTNQSSMSNSKRLTEKDKTQCKNGKLTHRKHEKSETGNKAKLKKQNGVTKQNSKIQTKQQKFIKSNKNHPKDNNERIKISGYLNLVANVVDNFTHGLAVAGSFCISTKVGCMTTMAILLHEIPHEIGDFAILLRSGFDRWKAAKAQLSTAFGGIVGAITALSVDSSISDGTTLWILPFTSGGFLYIALVTVMPDLLQEKHGGESVKQVACICLGVLSMLFVTVLFE